MRLLKQAGLFLLIMFSTSASIASEIPKDIKAIFDKPIYKNAKWGLRVIDAKTNKVLIDYNSGDQFYIGSVRKLFSVGALMNAVGADHRTTTTVHYDGNLRHGELDGNLVLVASGDITMGGRTKPDGTVAFTTFDHNEANSIGNGQLTTTDPLAGYKKLAQEVKRAGVRKISGDVVIDDRLFEPFDFHQQFYATPMFVNDDVIDVEIKPGQLNNQALINWRPHSAAFKVLNNSSMVEAGQPYTLELNPIAPDCFGKPDCAAEVKNNLPLDYVPPFTKAYPIIQTFRIAKPSNYARTIFIEALRDAGVDVSAVTLVKENPVNLLKDSRIYTPRNQLAALRSLPVSEHAKLIFKVSYNLGADTSLMLFGLSHGVRTMADSLQLESEMLDKIGIPSSSYHFIDGGGSGKTTASNTAVTDWLTSMHKSKSYKAFYNALPILSVDGSLAFVDAFKKIPSLKGAATHARAKTGTFIDTVNEHLVLEGQAFAGYIETKNKHQLIYHVVVNNVDIPTVESSVQAFQDEGIITAILWRDF